MDHRFSQTSPERHIVTLRLTSPVRFHFLHGGVLHGLLCRTFGIHPLPPGLIPFASESGRVVFDAGDEYRFGVTAVGDDRHYLKSLAAGLVRIGAMTRYAGSAPAVLQGNFEVVRIEPDETIQATINVANLGPDLTLQFLSPLRMQRRVEDTRPGRRYLDGDCFQAAHFLSRFWSRIDLLACGGGGLPFPIPEKVTASDPRLLWIDMPITSQDGESQQRPGGYTLGGVVGTVRLGGVTEPWGDLLALGSILHAGEKTHCGFGRFVIREVTDLSKDPLRPSRGLTDRLTDSTLLRESLDHVIDSSVAAGIDGVEPDDARQDAEAIVRGLQTDLAAGSYRPRELLGFVDTKPAGGLRALAIPTVRDRCIQRAACSLLGPAVENLLEDCSYAYRKGFSRTHAAVAIQRAYEQGYRYVLDADIEGFFDVVDWSRMLAKLRALFPYEDLVDLIEAWLAVPVVFHGRTVARRQGLPQGAPISPLLANLYLDEFDEELLGRDYRLVRYADDFVVLCRDLAEAERARSDAQAALGDLGLKLHEGKTSITTFDAGFSYLGYLFCRSLVLEQKKQPSEPAEAWVPDAVPRLSWLAQVPLREIREIIPSNSAEPVDAPQVVPLAQVNPVPETRMNPLYLSGPRTYVGKRGGLLVVEDEDGDPVEIPLREISHVVLQGPVNLTMPALLALARDQKPVYACHTTGELDVPLVTQDPDWRVWAAQGTRTTDPQTCLLVARAIVQAKLHNSTTVAVRFKLAGSEDAAPQLKALERACLDQQDPDGLRGLEGKGAALFFGMLRDSLPPEWGFQQRRRQPPPDPINAMLSLGYTLLYNHISTALIAVGLNPRLGFFHREHGAYHALACDVQEEFRHLVDALVWTLARRHEAKPRDFAPSVDGRYPCLMSKDLRRKFIARFETRLATDFRPPSWTRDVTYREFLFHQASSMREFVDNKREFYEPLRIHA